MAIQPFVDYTFYTTTFLGTTISADEFPSRALRASMYIDHVTHGRASKTIAEALETDWIEKIQFATCAVADRNSDFDDSGGEVITSESIGDHSISFATPQTNAKQLRDVAYFWLVGTGLLFGGFYEDEV